MRVVLPPPFTSGQSPHSGMYGFDHLQWRGLLHGKGRRQRALKSAFQSLEKGKKEENCPQLLCVFVGFSVQQLQLMLSKGASINYVDIILRIFTPSTLHWHWISLCSIVDIWATPSLILIVNVVYVCPLRCAFLGRSLYCFLWDLDAHEGMSFQFFFPPSEKNPCSSRPCKGWKISGQSVKGISSFFLSICAAATTAMLKSMPWPTDPLNSDRTHKMR